MLCYGEKDDIVPFTNGQAMADRLKELGVEPGDIKGIEDIHKLPFTTKDDLRENYPFGLLAVPKSQIARVQGTSGTTGKLTLMSYTANDVDLWGECVARCMTMAGLTEEDIIVLLGDVGANYYESRRDRKFKAALNRLEPTLFCIHGNHESRPSAIASYKTK